MRIILAGALLGALSTSALAAGIEQQDVGNIRQLCDTALLAPNTLETKVAVGQYCQDLLARVNQAVMAAQQAAQEAAKAAQDAPKVPAGPIAPPKTRPGAAQKEEIPR